MKRRRLYLILLTLLVLAVGLSWWLQKKLGADVATSSNNYVVPNSSFMLFGRLIYTDKSAASNISIVVGTRGVKSDSDGNYQMTFTKDDFWHANPKPVSALTVSFFDEKGQPLISNSAEIENIPLPTIYAPSGVTTQRNGSPPPVDTNRLFRSNRNFVLVKP